MEKSIETIWKEGFLKNDALVAPKLNNLYNQKSIDIVDKFKRMYKLNRIGIAVFAIIIIPLSYGTRMISMGILMSILFTVVFFIAQKYSKQLDQINKNTSSYEYLSAFNTWVKNMVALNSKLSTFMYPYIFIAMILGFWFIQIEDDTLGNMLINGIISEFPTTYLINGFPILLLIPFFIALGVIAFFGSKIGKWDINLVYGRILNRLENTLSDMEELRK